MSRLVSAPITLALPLLAALVVVPHTAAHARSHRMAQIPHGDELGCLACHLVEGGGGMNPFGLEIFWGFLLDGGQPEYTVDDTVDWGPALAGLDSDGDGYSNGEEFGDPEGTAILYLGTASNPGVATSTPCGNGTLEGPEACDGSELGGHICAGDGNVRCFGDCTLDVSECSGELWCGDGRIDGDETCDGDDPGDAATCEALGFASGILRCERCRLDTSGCVRRLDVPDAGRVRLDASVVEASDGGPNVPESRGDAGCGVAHRRGPWGLIVVLVGIAWSRASARRPGSR